MIIMMTGSISECWNTLKRPNGAGDNEQSKAKRKDSIVHLEYSFGVSRRMFSIVKARLGACRSG